MSIFNLRVVIESLSGPIPPTKGDWVVEVSWLMWVTFPAFILGLFGLLTAWCYWDDMPSYLKEGKANRKEFNDWKLFTWNLAVAVVLLLLAVVTFALQVHPYVEPPPPVITSPYNSN